MLFALLGLGGCGMTILGDTIYYMNRDITTWIYVAEGIIMGLVLVSYVFSMLTTRYWFKYF